MFLLVSVRHVGAHPDELQHGVSIQSSINLGKTFLRISRIRIIPSTQILARVFVYLPPFISKILDFICPMVLIFILIHFEWRDTENQQYHNFVLIKIIIIIILLILILLSLLLILIFLSCSYIRFELRKYITKTTNVCLFKETLFTLIFQLLPCVSVKFNLSAKL